MVDGVVVSDAAAAARPCAWVRCAQAATVQVLAGDLLRRRRRHHGFYCALHAVEASRNLRARAAVDVWFTVLGTHRHAQV